jgi:hypothetical protein
MDQLKAALSTAGFTATPEPIEFDVKIRIVYSKLMYKGEEFDAQESEGSGWMALYMAEYLWCEIAKKTLSFGVKSTHDYGWNDGSLYKTVRTKRGMDETVAERTEEVRRLMHNVKHVCMNDFLDEAVAHVKKRGKGPVKDESQRILRALIRRWAMDIDFQSME